MIFNKNTKPLVLTAVINTERSSQLPIADLKQLLIDFSKEHSLELGGEKLLDRSKVAIDFYILYNKPNGHTKNWSTDNVIDSLYQKLRSPFYDKECDFCIQKYNPVTRRKKVIFSDMDSTLIENETLDDIAEKAGVGKAVALITRKGINGKIDFQESMKKRLSLLKGVDIEPFITETLKQIRYKPGAKTLMQTLNHYGVITYMVTGGFDPIASLVKKKLKIKKIVCNQFKITNKQLQGTWKGDLVTGEKKLQVMETYLKIKGMVMEQSLAVGDGSNDIPMLQSAGLGISFRGTEKVRKSISHQIQFTPLTTLLYYQGYSTQEFIHE